MPARALGRSRARAAGSLPAAISLAVLFVCVACGGARPRIAAGATTTFALYTTPHVRLETDLEPSEARALALRFDRVHRALATAFFDCGTPLDAGVADVTLFAHRADYEIVERPSTGGVYSSPDNPGLQTTPRLVLSADEPGHAPAVQVFAHELTHRFVDVCFAELPTWANEGLARFYETVRVEGDQVIVGTAPYAFGSQSREGGYLRGVWVQPVRTREIPSPSSLIRLTPDEFYRSRQRGHGQTGNYASAWLLVHELLTGSDPELRARFLDYLSGLRDLREDATSLFWRRFADVGLDARIAPLLRATPQSQLRFAFRETESPVVEVVPMRAAEVDLRIAELLVARGAADTVAQAYLAAAEREPTTAVRALLLRSAALPVEERPALIARAEALAPDDREVLLARVILAPEGDSARLVALRERFRALADPSERELVALSRLEWRTGEDQSSLVTAERALAMSPSSLYARIQLGNAYARVGRMRAARALFLGAWNLVAETGSSISGWLEERLGAMPLPVPPPEPGPDEPSSIALLREGPPAIEIETTSGADLAGRPLGDTCRGHYAQAPVAVVVADADTEPVFVRVRAAEGVDTTLAIQLADGTVICDDDSGGALTAAVRISPTQGRMRIWAGTFEAAPGTELTIRVDRDAPSVRSWPTTCGDDASWLAALGDVSVGARVRIGPGTPVSAVVDGEGHRVEGSLNRVAAMEPYVGRDAAIASITGVDVAGCVLARLDVDGGRWLWRLRDLQPLP